MVVVNLRAVDVFPPLIENASVGQRPRGVVLLEVGGQQFDVAPVAVAAVEGGHLGEPAIDPTLAAAGDEDDAAVGQVAGLEIIPRAVGELADVAAVEAAIVEVIVGVGALAPSKQDVGGVVVEGRVADAALRVVDQDSDQPAG